MQDGILVAISYSETFISRGVRGKRSKREMQHMQNIGEKIAKEEKKNI